MTTPNPALNARADHPSPATPSLATQIYQWCFDADFAAGFQRQFERLIGALIVLSVCSVVFEQIPAIYLPNAQTFHWFDLITVGIFSVEYVLRLMSAPVHPEFAHKRYPRLEYACSLYALLDLLAIAPFYLMMFMTVDLEILRVLRLLRLMRMFKLSRQILPIWQEFQQLNQGRSLRAKIYAMLEPTGHSGRLHIIVDNFIVFWIALSILCVVLETVVSIESLFAAQFKWVDTIAFSIFTLEYVARVYSAPENPEFKDKRLPRWAQIKGGQALIDLLTILPFLLEGFLRQHLDLRFLRVFRLLRMFKLTRYTSATVTLMKVFRREWQIIFASVFVMLLLVLFTASVGYMFEHPAQPDKFENIPQAIYWSVITLASVGYGDLTPITPMGRFLTVLLSLVGIGIFAIPAGLLASAFTDQLRIDRESFRQSLKKSFASGQLHPELQEEIITEAERLHLSSVEFDSILAEVKTEHEQTLAAEELSFGHLMLDANVHPEFAAEQFRIIVAQLRLLLLATGEEQISSKLNEIDPSDQLSLQVMRVIAQNPVAKKSRKPAKEAPKLAEPKEAGPQLF